MSKIKIKVDGPKAKIFIDDKEIENVKGYELTQSVDKQPILKLDLIAFDAEIEGDGVMCVRDNLEKHQHSISDEIICYIDGKEISRLVVSSVNQKYRENIKTTKL